MANVEAALASSWLAQIGFKTVAVMGVPNCVASGLPFSIRLAGAELAQKRPVPLDSIPPPPPDDCTVASSPDTVMCNDHQASSTQSSLRIVDFEARRVFFCDKFEGALKWSCPPLSALTRCEEPPPSALRFELRPLPPVGSDSAHHLHCLCVNGGIPNAKVDRNWVNGLSADLGGVQPERMQFDVCSAYDDADSAVLFLCDDKDRVALAFCMNGGGHMGIEDNLIDHNQRLMVPYVAGEWQRVCFDFHWSDASLDFFVNGILIAQNVPFEDRHCSNLRNCFICNASEEACVLWSSFLASSVLHGSISSIAKSSYACGPVDQLSGTESICCVAGNTQCEWDVILNGSCDSALLQVVLRRPTGTGYDMAEALGFGFSTVFSLEPFNSAAIESCNRAVHGRDIARSLRVGDVFADVIFVAEGVRFPAHKVIVASRCVHFRSMFNSRMREALQPEIIIEDAGPVAFSRMLEFLYSGSYDSEADDGQLVLQVLSLSDRYMLQGLKRQCEAALRYRLDECCAVSMLRSADVCNAVYLREACVSYIVDHFKDIVITEQYAQLPSDLMLSVQKALAATLH